MSRDRDHKLELALKHELRAAGTPDRDACADAETLGAWSEGGLEAAQMASVELHVATCARCQSIVGAAARSAPLPIGTGAPGAFSMWKWWLAPITAAAAAATLWMVVPEEAMQAPPSSGPAVAARKDSPIQEQAKAGDAASQAAAPVPGADDSIRDATRGRDNTAPPAREDRQERSAAALERKAENAIPGTLAETVTVGAAAGAPASPPAPSLAAEATRQNSARAVAPLEIVSPDPLRRWRVIAGAIERSEDAGASWIAVRPAAGDVITGGTAPAGAVCWLIGSSGVVLVTADGVTFARAAFPERVELTAVSATDARTATVTTGDGRRFRTDDSGRTWRQIQA